MSSLYIKRFVDRLQQCESKGNRDFMCPIADAKNLHNDITRLLLVVEELQSQVKPNQNQSKTDPEQTITVELTGGDF